MIRYFRPYQSIDLSAVSEQDLYAPNTGNGSECYDPDRFRFTTIRGGILIGAKSHAGKLRLVQQYWNDTTIVG